MASQMNPEIGNGSSGPIWRTPTNYSPSPSRNEQKIVSSSSVEATAMRQPDLFSQAL